MNEEIYIHPWHQFLHSLRTNVTTLHHNVSAALAETFAVSWHPTGEAVWLLGRRYDTGAVCDAAAAEGGAVVDSGEAVSRLCAEATSEPAHPDGTPDEFATAWSQITRMTYRKGFAPMYRPVSVCPDRQQYVRLTSDAGWGCMIRVGQMLLATALRRHYDHGFEPFRNHCGGSAGLRDHGCRPSPPVDDASPPLELQFLDDPSPKKCPFSIFEFIRAAHGREVVNLLVDGADVDGFSHEDETAKAESTVPTRKLTHKLPGDWFGPTTISETIAALVERAPGIRSNLSVYVNADGVLYEDEVRFLGCAQDSKQSGPCSRDPSQRHTGDSDEDFMVVSAASVASCSEWSPLVSPKVDPCPVPPMRSSTGEFETACSEEVLHVTSFHELPSPLVSPSASIRELKPDGATWKDRDEEVACPLVQSIRLDEEHIGTSWGGSAPFPMQESTSSSTKTSRWKKAVLLLFPLQLGLDRYVNEAYIPSVLRYFELRSSLGAMGGRPRMAHFFVGRHGHDLLFVDPHVVQPAAIPSDGPQYGSETFRNLATVQTMSIEQIDSSISLAFYCSSEADLAELVEGVRWIDSTQVNAPVRAEATRPPALRFPHMLTGTAQSPWCDLEGMTPSTDVFQYDDQILSMSPDLSFDSEGACPAHRAVTDLPESPSEDCVDFIASPLVPSGERKIVVGAPWALGGEDANFTMPSVTGAKRVLGAGALCRIGILCGEDAHMVASPQAVGDLFDGSPCNSTDASGEDAVPSALVARGERKISVAAAWAIIEEVQ